MSTRILVTSRRWCIHRGRTFYEKLHQHEEIQLSYIIAGKGTFIVGDTIRDFQSDDVLLFGSNVPHVLKSDPENNQDSYMISVFFTRDSFGEHFFNLPKLKDAKRLFNDASLGIKFQEHQTVLKPLFQAILHQKSLKRFAAFFEILSILAESKYKTVSSFMNTKNYTDVEGKRMSAVFEFVMNHFDQKILLEEIATIASMTPNAFCKYFKQRTNKTFFKFLTEVRIENACTFLSNQQQIAIANIAHDCGFFNISNFNRKFKEIKGVTPTEFRKKVF